MNKIEIKSDCFAYDKTKNKCRVLTNLYCECEKCKFYKSKEKHKSDLNKTN